MWTRISAAALCTVMLGGCAFGAARGGRTQSSDSFRRLARYAVVAKEAPNTLVADNQFRCQVDAERYREVKVGDRVWCMWG